MMIRKCFKVYYNREKMVCFGILLHNFPQGFSLKIMILILFKTSKISVSADFFLKIEEITYSYVTKDQIFKDIFFADENLASCLHPCSKDPSKCPDKGMKSVVFFFHNDMILDNDYFQIVCCVKYL